MLTVYKASAGSGKTFQLVVEYLKLLLDNPFNYKHILAVTFTNKATKEMKTRIMETLNQLATNQQSAYIAELQKDNNHTEDIIRKRAKQVLKNILHDYNRFSISTIDSFTQKTIKAFNRELGISPNYTVELDSEMILAEATDRMLAKIDKDKKLLTWLKEFSKEKIEDSYSQRIEDDIKTLGKELFKENFQLFFPENSESVYSRENLNAFGKDLNLLKTQFENSLKSLGKKGVESIATNGLSVDDFSGKARGIGSQFEKYANGQQPNITKTVENAAIEVEKWYTKTSAKKSEIHALVESTLQPLLIEILDCFKNKGEEYFTTLALLKQLRMLGILTDLKEEIKTLLHEKGVLQMSDSNLLLSKIIGQSDSPFIYEKTGNYYKHFMLDEFQDTSGLQWNNFKPLLLNSLAEGNNNLIVGDVKQSIYRWRNSDWQILAEQLNTDFSVNQRNEKHLKNNWRSDKNIIDFNNSIFENLKITFKEIQFRTIKDPDEIFIQKFNKVYESIEQIPGKSEEEKKGLINIQFLEEDDFSDNSTELLVEQVKKLQDKGIQASEIAILIRTNKEGTPIIREFLSAAKRPENSGYNLSVLSNESLFLHASKSVLFVINTIELIIDSENEIAKVSLLNQWINWLKPALEKRGKLITVKNNQTELNFDNSIIQALDENFQEYFDKELLPKIQQIKEKILLTSLDESITQIASIFQLFEIETELPYLQTLVDKSGELKTSLSNDLSNLLFWWNEKGFKTSVSVNEEINSIRLLTVHKSKGLEFKAVLLPYFNWKTSTSGKLAPILWCRPTTKPFNQFPLLPLVAGSQMEKSIFKKEYYEEKVNAFVDTFNLVYVAFTRAKSALIINCPLPKEPKKGATETSKPMHYLLNKALEKLSSNKLFAESWNIEKTEFRFGAIEKSENNSEVSKSVLIDKYHFNDFGDRIKLRLSGEDFLIQDKNKISIKNQGKLIHDILSKIETKKDIEPACNKAFFDGLINESELNEIKTTLEKSMENPEISRWFDGSYSVINERNLLSKDKLLRPDRIMILGKSAIIVDYKTGENKSTKYNSQVKHYANVLKETGFEKVEAFLWYINQNELEKVCEI